MTAFPALAGLPRRPVRLPALPGFPPAAAAETAGLGGALVVLDAATLPLSRHEDAVLQPLGPWLGQWWQGGAQDAAGAFIPESGLYHWAQELPNVSLAGASPGPAEAALEETVLWGGYLPPHHGHFLIEGLARLWAWPQPEARRIAFLGAPQQLNPVMWAMLDAAGIPREAMLFVERPTRVRRLLVPYPSSLCFCLSSTAWGETVRRIGDAVAPDGPRTDQPLYLSRSRFAQRGWVRGVAGEAALEAVLRQAGFAIAYPEELDLAQVVALMRRHRCLVGQIGSALHWSVFGRPGPRLVGIAAHAIPPTYQLCDEVIGAEATYLWGPDAAIAEPAHPPVGLEHQPVALDVPAVLEGLRGLGLLPAGLSPPPEGRRAAVEAEYLSFWQRSLREHAAVRPAEPGYAAAAETVAARLAGLGR